MSRLPEVVDSKYEETRALADEAAKAALKRFLISWQFVAIVLSIIIISVSISVALSYMQ